MRALNATKFCKPCARWLPRTVEVFGKGDNDGGVGSYCPECRQARNLERRRPPKQKDEPEPEFDVPEPLEPRWDGYWASLQGKPWQHVNPETANRLWHKIRYFTVSRGYPELADDVAQYALLQAYQGKFLKPFFVLAQFLEREFGRTGTELADFNMKMRYAKEFTE